MTIPVQFTLEAAQRISNAVRRVEIGDRAQAPLTFDSFIPQGTKQIAYGHRRPTDFSSWAYGDVKTVVLHGVSKKTPVLGAAAPGSNPPVLGTHEDYVEVQARNMVGNLESFDVVDHSALIPTPGPYRAIAKPSLPTLILAKSKSGWDNARTEWHVIGPTPAQTVYGKITGRVAKGSAGLVMVRRRYTDANPHVIDSVMAVNPFGAIGTPRTQEQDRASSASGLGVLAYQFLTIPGTQVAMVRTSGASGSLWVIVAAECP